MKIKTAFGGKILIKKRKNKLETRLGLHCTELHCRGLTSILIYASRVADKTIFNEGRLVQVPLITNSDTESAGQNV